MLYSLVFLCLTALCQHNITCISYIVNKTKGLGGKTVRRESMSLFWLLRFFFFISQKVEQKNLTPTKRKIIEYG